MSEQQLFPVPAEAAKRALIDAICHDHPFAIPWPQLHWPP